ncbi:hypothetical protein [Maribellus maritimus]|uniref:hypothetical protein n=1 Tax=Maribellus maritimus TaxID=2870838 RepID=UPI001EEC1514|nr:hypothetical protein [Maribellus maritimus]MCG6186108.1 hypothetical protein [Maribellus maritimus]
MINELRNKILECDVIEENHRQRVLERLEKLQSELHIKMTNYDRIFGFVVEANLLYQNYKEAKPIFELAVKIANITLETMALANGLPAATLIQLPL